MYLAQQQIELTGAEFSLLYLLAQKAGQVISKAELSEQALGKLASFVSAQLAAAPVGGGQPFISPDLADGATPKSGYFVLVADTAAALDVLTQANTCNNIAPSRSMYHVSANPVTPGQTGSRFLISSMTYRLAS